MFIVIVCQTRCPSSLTHSIIHVSCIMKPWNSNPGTIPPAFFFVIPFSFNAFKSYIICSIHCKVESLLYFLVFFYFFSMPEVGMSSFCLLEIKKTKRQYEEWTLSLGNRYALHLSKKFLNLHVILFPTCKKNFPPCYLIFTCKLSIIHVGLLVSFRLSCPLPYDRSSLMTLCRLFSWQYIAASVLYLHVKCLLLLLLILPV